MSDVLRWLAARPWIIVAGVGAALLWNLLYAVGRIRKIRRSGKTVLARVPDGALFVEKWTSGGSGKSFWTRLGGAKNCLLVALTRERLVVRPHCPFSIFADRFDLEHDVPLAEIAGVKAVGREVQVELPGRTLKLLLRDPGNFLGVWKLVRGV